MVPIITHPERNQPLLKKQELVLELVELGCLVQVTANAVTGAWGMSRRRWRIGCCKREAVHVIASDAHDPVNRRPIMSEARDAVAELAGAERRRCPGHPNPEAIVDGRPLPYWPRG